MHRSDIKVRLPEGVGGLSQHEEYFILVEDRTERKIRLHDYEQMYQVPGLYDYLLSDLLQCRSPEILSDLLMTEVQQTGGQMSDLIALDLGAGTGLVGAALFRHGVQRIVGIDILPQAAAAAARERPGMYERYYVADLLHLSAACQQELRATSFSCMTCISALSTTHVPPLAFIHGYNLIAPNGWIAFNIREPQEPGQPATPFELLIERITAAGILDLYISHSYCHRLAIDGSPINYLAMIGQKRADIPEDLGEK